MKLVGSAELQLVPAKQDQRHCCRVRVTVAAEAVDPGCPFCHSACFPGLVKLFRAPEVGCDSCTTIRARRFAKL